MINPFSVHFHDDLFRYPERIVPAVGILEIPGSGNAYVIRLQGFNGISIFMDPAGIQELADVLNVWLEEQNSDPEQSEMADCQMCGKRHTPPACTFNTAPEDSDVAF